MREYDLQMTSKKLSAAMLKRYDAVLISTDHSVYDYQSIVDNTQEPFMSQQVKIFQIYRAVC